MTFADYRSFFKPDELNALTAAYDSAWKHLCAAHSAMTPAQEADLKERLAKMILASACTGERDPERLTEIALRGLGKTPSLGEVA
jgi:hypothetical protein